MITSVYPIRVILLFPNWSRDYALVNDTSSTSPLSAGGSTTKTWGWQATPGPHSIKVVVDSKNEVDENDETNNTKIISIDFGQPDDN
jgi:subtilase family serine protease